MTGVSRSRALSRAGVYAPLFCKCLLLMGFFRLMCWGFLWSGQLAYKVLNQRASLGVAAVPESVASDDQSTGTEKVPAVWVIDEEPKSMTIGAA